MANRPFKGSNWMSYVDDSKFLSELTIPGTHDTAGRYGTDQLITQTHSILEQLENGIRFLDIRCRQDGKVFAIHHDIQYEKINFGTVLGICFGFLNSFPRQTIIMSVKPEDDSLNPEGTFEQVFNQYVEDHGGIDKWYFRDTIPTLKDVRGKIVLFRRFPTDKPETVKGINALAFEKDASFTIKNTATIKVQDNWVVETVFDRPEKWKQVLKYLEEARTSTEKKTTLYVNFTSGGSGGSYPNNVAEYVNPRLLTYFLNHPQAHCGIIPMDFEDARHTILMAHTNTPYTDGYWILTNKGEPKPFGNARSHGQSDTNKTDAVDMAVTPSGKGYWIVFKHGGVYPGGDAVSYGHSTRRNNDTVAIAARPDGTRYWLLFKDGTVQGFGGVAKDYGHGTNDGKDAVDIVTTSTGKGYWILSKSGGVHACGDAEDYGSGIGGDNEAVAMEATSDDKGYWILSKNGGVHRHGNAKHHGHGTDGHGDAVSIVRGETNGGYWILAKDGTVLTYGTVPYDGDGLTKNEGGAVSLCKTVTPKL